MRNYKQSFSSFLKVDSAIRASGLVIEPWAHTLHMKNILAGQFDNPLAL